MNILVTGAAGFIGAHVAERLLARGDTVTGLDNVNDYYDPALKEARLSRLVAQADARSRGVWTFHRCDLADAEAVADVFARGRFDRVIHLAAQAGVRYSLANPHAYVASNVTGFLNVIEACRRHEVAHLTYASTSSVYGANTHMPYAEQNGVDHPLQFYAVTKRTNELTAHAYANLYGLPVTGLRFFTVYGPWGRPDMAFFLFTKNIFAGDPIKVFNHGNHTRDFTYVDDIAEGVVRASDQIATPDPEWRSDAPNPSTSAAPFRIYNIGNSTPVRLMDYIKAIEAAVGRDAVIELLPMQPGDVPDTLADVSALETAVGYTPATPVDVGIARFVDWYRGYYGV
ncbi:MAG: NAD-dependent epimerase [Pseudomonadota bacterium]